MLQKVRSSYYKLFVYEGERESYRGQICRHGMKERKRTIVDGRLRKDICIYTPPGGGVPAVMLSVLVRYSTVTIRRQSHGVTA